MCKRKNANINEDGTESKIKSIPKMICHVFESEEAKFIAQTVSQAFQISYRKFLKTSGAEDKVIKGVKYPQVFDSRQSMRNELERLVKIECPKEVCK
jgi:amyloid beta A4 protein (APP)-binding protein, putative